MRCRFTGRATTLMCLFLFGSIAAMAQEQRFGHYRGPKSLGTYTHAHRISLRPFLANFGAQPSGRYAYCFADKEHGLYLYAKIDDEHDRGQVNSVFLSSFPNCRHMQVTSATIDPNVWVTPHGIGIGSTKQSVLHAYPYPTFSEKLPEGAARGEILGLRDTEVNNVDFGDRTYLYSCMIDERNGCDDLQAAQFGFFHGKVIWIAISDSE